MQNRRSNGGVRLTGGQRADLAKLDDEWRGGEGADPAQVARAVVHWRGILGLPPSAGEERFDVVAPEGTPLSWTAPRWFCHLTGLRHRVSHILLESPQRMLLLQLRSATKSQWPSHLDTSVGGHLRAGQGWREAAIEEMRQELGLTLDALEDGELEALGPISARREVIDGPRYLRNRQLNQLFWGRLTPQGLAAVSFEDREVAGVLLVSRQEAQRIVEAGELVAPGLSWALAQVKAR